MVCTEAWCMMHAPAHQNAKELDSLEEKKEGVLKDTMRRVFEQFIQHYDLWMTGKLTLPAPVSLLQL